MRCRRTATRVNRVLLSTAAAVWCLALAGTARAQSLSAPSLTDNSSAGEVCAGCDPSYDRQSAAAVQSTSATSFSVRYASTDSTDGGALCNSRTETEASDYTIQFTVTAPGAYYIDVSTQLTGQLDVVYDGGLVGG